MANLKDSIGEIKNINVVYGGKTFDTGFSIKDVSAKEILLTTLSNDSNSPNVGDSIRIILFCSNGVFSFESKILGVESNFPYTFWHIASPKEFEVNQGRQFFRTKFNLKAELKTTLNNGKTLLFECQTNKISGSGVSLIIPSVLRSKTSEIIERENINKFAKFSLSIYFPDRVIRVKVEFVHKKMLSQDSKTIIYAFKFSNLSPTDCDYITKQCFAKQLLEQNKSKNEF